MFMALVLPAAPVLAIALAVRGAAHRVSPATANGRPVGARARRIVSLIPSLTEDLFAIGAGGQVVGVSQYTDFPAAARTLPVVSSFASIDTERVVRLHPDLVVGIPAQAALVAPARRAGLRVELLPDETLADLYASLERLGTLAGQRSAAQSLARRLRERTAALVRTVPQGARPRTFVVLDVAPIFTVGDRSYVAALIRLAGGSNAARIGAAYARYGAEALVAAQPDVIVADRQSGLQRVLDRPPWSVLTAVRRHRVYVLRDPDVLERPGPRYNDGLAWLIVHLHEPAQ